MHQQNMLWNDNTYGCGLADSIIKKEIKKCLKIHAFLQQQTQPLGITISSTFSRGENNKHARVSLSLSDFSGNNAILPRYSTSYCGFLVTTTCQQSDGESGSRSKAFKCVIYSRYCTTLKQLDGHCIHSLKNCLKLIGTTWVLGLRNLLKKGRRVGTTTNRSCIGLICR